ncbi:MAG: G1 family glutamic endopeptidase [Thermoguttaceae bacterium]
MAFSQVFVAARQQCTTGASKSIAPAWQASCRALSAKLATAAAAVVLCSAPLSAGTIFVPASDPPVEMAAQLHPTQNWAGYAVESDLGNQQVNNDSVTAVSGSWIVPAVTPPAANPSGLIPQCAVWVGIDGLDNKTVEQTGTTSYVLGNKAYYYAWTEMYPAGVTEIAPIVLRVSAGDSMTASVQYDLPGSPNEFLLSITDNTTGKSYTALATSPTASRASAEWIAEAPTTESASGSTTIGPLPAFGSVTFSNAWATIGSTTGAIDNPAWQVADVTMQNGSDAMAPMDLTTVGSGAAATSSFTVVQQVPEPSTLAILATAAAVLGLRGLHAAGVREFCPRGRLTGLR